MYLPVPLDKGERVGENSMAYFFFLFFDETQKSSKHVNSDSHGFEQIDPQARVLNYCFQ